MRLPLALLALVLAASTSRAGVITQSSDFDLSVPLIPGSVGTADAGFLFLERFDTSLGTLTQVDIDITARTVVVGSLPASQVPVPGGLLPQPYAFSLEIAHDFGLWPVPGGVGSPVIRYVGNASGNPTSFVSTIDFSHALSITELTDLIGFAPVSTSSTTSGSIEGATAVFIPPVTSSVERADFEAPIPGIPLTLIFPVLDYTWVGQGVGGPVSGSVGSTGTITVSYLYDGNQVPMPEPGAIALLVTGLALWGHSRRRA